MEHRRHIAERVRALLEDRDAQPGDRLPPERDLAAQLGVSRPSLREGLARLSDLGIIESRHGSGTYLAEVDLEDLVMVRLRLEPLAARLAAERRSDGDLEVLDDAYAALAATEDDPKAFADADLAFHMAVTDVSASPSLSILVSTLSDLLRHSRAVTVSDAALRRNAVRQSRRILAAIRAADPDAAEQAMHDHLKRVEATVAEPSATPKSRA